MSFLLLKPGREVRAQSVVGFVASRFVLVRSVPMGAGTLSLRSAVSSFAA